MSATPSPDEETVIEGGGRGQLLRRLLVFQFKLALDGLRDLLLSPVSFFAVLYGVFTRSDHPAEPFDRLLDFGRRTDAWIDLFEAHGPRDSGSDSDSGSDDAAAGTAVPGAAAAAPAASADAMFDAVERAVREELDAGGGFGAVEARLRSLRRSTRRRTPPAEGAEPALEGAGDEGWPREDRAQ